jgi:hypothetical protein
VAQPRLQLLHARQGIADRCGKGRLWPGPG